MAKVLKKNAAPAADAAPAKEAPAPSNRGSIRSEKNVLIRGKTNGLKVSACYKEIFEANERLAAGKPSGSDLSLFKGKSKPCTDEEISAYMKAEYGSRGGDNHLVVSRNRKAFNAGTYPAVKEGEKRPTSHAYDAEGNVKEARKGRAPKAKSAAAVDTKASGNDAAVASGVTGTAPAKKVLKKAGKSVTNAINGKG